MKKIIFIIPIFILAVSGCNKLLDDPSADLDSTAKAVTDTVTDGMSNVNNSGSGNISKVLYPRELLENLPLKDRLDLMADEIFSPQKAYAVSATCPGGGSDTHTDPVTTWGVSADTAFYVTRIYSACTGAGGILKVDGDDVLNWSGLLSGKIYLNKFGLGATPVLKQAPYNKKFTRISDGSYIMVVGNDPAITDSTTTGLTPAGPYGPAGVAHKITWTASGAPIAFTLHTNLTRTGYDKNGKEIFQHIITTPTDLIITVGVGTRTINAGSISVQHVLAGFTLTATFNNVVFQINDGNVTQGTINLSVAGLISGSGTITFDGKGGATYSFTIEGKTYSASYTLSKY